MYLIKVHGISPDTLKEYSLRINAEEIAAYSLVIVDKKYEAVKVHLKSGTELYVKLTLAEFDKHLEGFAPILWGK